MARWRRAVTGIALFSLPALLLVGALLEGFFRLVLPASEIPHVYFDRDSGVLRYDTTGQRTGTFTTGKYAQQRGRWRINNAGWNSPIDYRPRSERSKPLVAIIGDSYVEAFHVDNDRNLAAFLRNRAGERFDVYSFGIAGAPLSQYLQMSRYVRKQFQPDLLIMNVVHNDFEESIRKFRPNYSYYMQLELNDGHVRELPPEVYIPNPWRRWMAHSAIVRALYLNLKVQGMMNWTRAQGGQFNANVDVDTAWNRRNQIREATEYLARTLIRENRSIPVVFMLDALRGDIYAGSVRTSHLLWLHTMMSDLCAKGFFLDLTDDFADRYQKTGRRYESESDYHWNEVGHEAAADALFSFLTSHDLIPKR